MIGSKKRPAEQEPVNTGPRVSELLKTTRERLGEDLQTVSQVLRIRYVYLEAIEAGRYQDLPGKTYVVGFVRAYAEHLGLDVEEVVNRFKLEVDGLEAKEEFVFPSPVTEQSVPGGAIILISLIILGAAYGGWYFLSSQDRSMAELVPDLPAKFAEMINKVKDSKKEEETVVEKTEEKVEEVVAAVEKKAEETVSEANTQDMAEQARKAVEKAEAEAQKVEADAEQVVKTVKVESTAVVAEKVEAVEGEVKEEEKSIVEKVKDVIIPEEKKVEETAQKVEEKVEETVAAVSSAVTPAQAEKKEEPEAAAVEEKKEEEKPAKPVVMNEKIILKALDYAWIQVVDGEGNEVNTQVLNEGDEYTIPAVQGLELRTGNAGGLEISVDGKKAPALGSSGEVLRKVMLNPAKLLDGSAVQR